MQSELSPGQLWERFRAAMRDTGRRTIYFSAIAIPGHLFITLSKTVVLVFDFSWFLTANVMFTLGLGAVKLLLVLSNRRAVRDGLAEDTLQTYRLAGVIVFTLSVAYIASCLLLVLGIGSTSGYSPIVAIVILAIAFIELGFSVHGLISSRRRGDLLMEAVKLSNLASSLLLLVLAQTALLSLAAGTSIDPLTQEPTTDPTSYNGLTGIVLGAIAALIGLTMIIRNPTASDTN